MRTTTTTLFALPLRRTWTRLAKNVSVTRIFAARSDRRIEGGSVCQRASHSSQLRHDQHESSFIHSAVFSDASPNAAHASVLEQRAQEEMENLASTRIFFLAIIIANGLGLWCEIHNPKSFLRDLGTANRGLQAEEMQHINDEDDDFEKHPALRHIPSKFRKRQSTKFFRYPFD